MIVNLICHTDGCENNGAVVQFVDPADTCICGPCGVEITDKQPVE